MPMALGTAWTQAGSFLLKSAAFCPQGSVPVRACACIMTHTYAHVLTHTCTQNHLAACFWPASSADATSTSSAEATFALETQVPSRRRSEHLAETHFEKHSLCGSLSYTLVPTGSPTPLLPWLAGALGEEGSSWGQYVLFEGLQGYGDGSGTCSCPVNVCLAFLEGRYAELGPPFPDISLAFSLVSAGYFVRKNLTLKEKWRVSGPPTEYTVYT